MIRKEAWPFYTTISGVRLCWGLEEPNGPKGSLATRFPCMHPRRASVPTRQSVGGGKAERASERERARGSEEERERGEEKGRERERQRKSNSESEREKSADIRALHS